MFNLKLDDYDRVGKVGVDYLTNSSFLGPWIFAIVAADVVIFLLVLWLKPEWLDKM